MLEDNSKQLFAWALASQLVALIFVGALLGTKGGHIKLLAQRTPLVSTPLSSELMHEYDKPLNLDITKSSSQQQAPMDDPTLTPVPEAGPQSKSP